MKKEGVVTYMRKDFQEWKKNVSRSNNIIIKSHDKKPTLNKTICNKKKRKNVIKMQMEGFRV
jgi:hypothetical protein